MFNQKIIFTAIALVFGLSLVGCAGDKLEGPGVENQDPTVWLSAAPPEGTVARYTLHLYWGGWDPDGEIRYYEYCITNNESGVFAPEDTTGSDKWGRVFRNDSTFTFTADQLSDSASVDPDNLQPVDFSRSHTFFIRAVDEFGLASRKPAYRSFTSRTLSPTVDITIPTSRGATPAEVPPISTFTWVGTDYISNEREVQQPDSVRWILVPRANHENSFTATLNYIRENPDAEEWSDWTYYKLPGDSGRFWTTPALEIGSSYMFAVQVKDEAGAISAVFDEDRNVRRINVSPRSTGPIVTLKNKFIGTIITSSPNTDPAIIDLPSNIQMCFRITANAESYGGVASGYRYGWDIQDPSVPSQWETDFTPFTKEENNIPAADIPCRAWAFDVHTIYIEAIDNSGYTTRVAVTVNVVPFSMSKSVYLIDDWRENSPGFGPSNGAVPSDGEHDAFWEEMLGDVDGFDPVRDVLEVTNEVPLTAFAEYKALIWVAAASYNAKTASFINNVIRFVDPEAQASTGKTVPNTVSLFMAAGGNVMLVGEQIMCASINRDSFSPVAPVYPLIFRYELSGDQDGSYESSDLGVRGIGEESFSYQDCCLNVIDVAFISSRLAIRRAGKHGCPINTVRPAPQIAANDGLRVAIPDSSRTLVFPELTLRPEVAAPGKWYAEERSGVNADIYNPSYFASVPKGGTNPGTCNDFAELIPGRTCFEPVYLNGCRDTNSKIRKAAVAFWTSAYNDTIPDSGGMMTGRSLIMGFHPVYFNPTQVKKAMEIVLFDEWGLPRKQSQ